MSKPISLTRDELAALEPCDKEQRLALFGRRKSMNAAQALKAGASIRDLLWVANRLGRRDLCVKFALAGAQRVAYLNTDPRVQAALDAVGVWLTDPSDENMALLRKAREGAWDARRAADAAYAAADAAADADAAYAAAYAAAAAAHAAAAHAAAYAAADAAAAAAYAADAADAYAARKAEVDAQRAIFLEIFG